MSVINNMLRDLQDRKAPLGPVPGLVVTARPSAPVWAYLFGLLAAGGLLAAATVWSPTPETIRPVAIRMVPTATTQSTPAPITKVNDTKDVTSPAVDKQATTKVAVTKESSPPVATAVVAAVVAVTGASAPLVANANAIMEAAAPAAGVVEKQPRVQTPQQQAQTLYRRATDTAATGHGRQAVDLVIDALKLDPSLHEARHFAVSLLYEQERLDEAELLAVDGLNRSPQQAPLAYLLARIMTERGRNLSAIAVLDRQTTLTADGHGLRASILSQSGDFKKASQDYQIAVQQQPDNSLWWFGLAVAMEALGQTQDARKVYAKAQALGLDRPDLTAFVDQKLRTLN
ncbi:MAG: tetratricopeptide repeat protein [Pseudomonadota bacterium]